jgi:pimeloyl-ACP methyl ester carboxylesterase
MRTSRATSKPLIAAAIDSSRGDAAASARIRGASRRSRTPATHYARSGDVNIAYQVIGTGPIDLVFVMGWVSHLDCFWTEPTFARFLRRLSEFSRVILFDKRGTGCRIAWRAADARTAMDDVRAVMAAAGSREAVLLGVSEGGPMCGLFATTYPERTRALVMIGTYAKRRGRPTIPGRRRGGTRALPGERSPTTGAARWASTRARRAAPRSRRSETGGATICARGPVPAPRVTLTQMNAEIDVRDVLPHVRVPTLVLHRIRRSRRCSSREGATWRASMPGAQFVELPGDDHLPFVGDQDAMIDAIAAFVTSPRDAAAGPCARDGAVRADRGRRRDAAGIGSSSRRTSSRRSPGSAAAA